MTTVKKLKKDILSMTAAGITMGAGASIADAVGSSNASVGIANLSRAMPTIGNVVGYGALLRTARKRKKR